VESGEGIERKTTAKAARVYTSLVESGEGIERLVTRQRDWNGNEVPWNPVKELKAFASLIALWISLIISGIR